MHLSASTSPPARLLRRPARYALALLACGTLAACTVNDDSGRKFWQPYRASVQQGNWVTQQQVERLQPGMTREQVRFVLGSPTLTPIFHADRWVYPYRYKPGYGEVDARRLVVHFQDDRLLRWEGDAMPTVQPFQEAEVEAREAAAAEAYNERYDIPDVTEGEPDGAIGTSGSVNPELPQGPLPDAAEIENDMVDTEGMMVPGEPVEINPIAPEVLEEQDTGALPRGTLGPGTDTVPLR